MTFASLWSALAPIGKAASGGYRRFAWTREDATLREWFAGEAAARGMDVVADRAGNQWAWWGDPDVTPGVVTGSHLDSVPDGGAFDGPLGVVSGFLAVDALRAAGVVPSRPVGVVNFGDEEGARFGVACAGSRLITGALSPDRARSLQDADGVTMAEAMGSQADHLDRDDETLRRVRSFVELHVEQGRGLVDLGYPVGMGSEIRAHGRWRIDLPGTANHAGTTSMADRDDAAIAMAMVILAAREAARRRMGVATCGKVRLVPNGVNAIASHATVWLDARAATAEQVHEILGDVSQAVPNAQFEEESWTDTTEFHPWLTREMAGLLGDVPVLDTGAGHDAGILAAAGVRAAMIFVRNPTGVSHSPAEFALEEDCLAGVEALTTVLARLAS